MRFIGAARAGGVSCLLAAGLGFTWPSSAFAQTVVTPVPLADPELVQRVLDQGVLLVDGASAEGTGHGATTALVVFRQPVSRAYRLLSQPSRQGEYRPDIDSIERISMHPEGPVDEHRMSIMFMQIAYRLRYRFDPGARRIHWELDPGFENSLELVSGSWELHGLDDASTLARFRTAVRVGKGIPSWIEEGVTRRNIPETLEHCRQWIDSDGRWRP